MKSQSPSVLPRRGHARRQYRQGTIGEANQRKATSSFSRTFAISGFDFSSLRPMKRIETLNSDPYFAGPVLRKLGAEGGKEDSSAAASFTSELGASPLVVTDRDSHREMFRIMARLHEQFVEENPYVGDVEARQLVEEAQKLPDRVEPDRVEEVERCLLFLRLGLAELKLGRESAAIEHLTKATRIASTPSVGSQLVEPSEAAFLLGVAWMRVAESKDCCQRTTPDSCIFPLEGQGVHVNTQPSKMAASCFRKVLRTRTEESELHLQARWLLNIAYMTLGTYPKGVPQEFLIPPAAFESAESLPRFVNVGGRLGINTFSMCGGAIADDFDGDGAIDLVVSS